MLVELGNVAPAIKGEPLDSEDKRPVVTRIDIPDYTYSHKPGGITVQEFQNELREAEEYRNGIYRLPDHEALLIVRNAFKAESIARPAWVHVTPHHEHMLGDHQLVRGSTHEERVSVAEDFEGFLHEHFGTDGKRRPGDVEDTHWTRWGAPGHGPPPPTPPDITNTYTVDGRIMNNFNDGGDSLTALGVVTGVATGATATGLSGASGLTSSGLVGHRIYVYSTTSNNLVWGNVTANAATTVTVDQWYNVSTPGLGGGGTPTPGTTPTTPWAFVVVDGGMVSTWFAGLATGANATVNTDHTLSTNGNVEYLAGAPVASSTLCRKQCPAAVTVSATARTVTLVPVFTVASADVANMPKTFTTVGFFASIIMAFGAAGGPMKFETTMSASATVAALSDQITVTETISGS